MPPLTNHSLDILSAWTALEVLSPQSFKKESDLVPEDEAAVARFDKHPLPWTVKQTPRNGKRLYFELYLGTVMMAPAVEAMLKIYSDRRPEKPSVQGSNPIASVILDEFGRPLESDGSACVSSFAWGVPIALKGDLRKLGDWQTHQQTITKAFRDRLIARNWKNDIEPLTKERISELYLFLIGALGLGNLETKAPYFAIRRYESDRSKTAPEPNILNSFFLEDLEIARSLVKSNAVPNALSHYLGIKSVSQRTDLLKDRIGLRDLIQPKSTPWGRWTGKDRKPLVLLQQAAVNATGIEQLPTGVLGVNGPPGTGKTTLLRDVVAAKIIERATIMAAFEQPADAFRPSSVSLNRSGGSITLYHLNDRLKGFEMVVASSNNKAVENVSSELPAIDAVADDATDLRYFNSISDNVSERETWGLIAAVLGKATNRYRFSQSFWKDEENGLSTYLNHAIGQPQFVVQSANGRSIKRLRKVVERERPPQNAEEAYARWNSARSRFNHATRAFATRQEQLQKLHLQSNRLVAIDLQAKASAENHQTLVRSIHEIKAQAAELMPELRTQEQAHSACKERGRRHAKTRPGLVARLLRSAAYSAWKIIDAELASELSRHQSVLASMKERHRVLAAEMKRTTGNIEAEVSKRSKLVAERRSLEKSIHSIPPALKPFVPDADFFKQAYEDYQKSNAWFDTGTNILRDNVFQEAIKLHRAFIDCAADPIRQNLSILTETFGTRSLGTPEKDAMISELWASFFLVVPVVSTTFASVHRMFSRLKPESLGWLLVDEAGQAVPQAAVGAMIRTKRSVVVGDPLQIEPVVTLPDRLTEKLCGYFGVDPLRYNAPEASVQTLADAASSFCARFPIGSGSREVGAPLLVHRRCNSPMFDISNEIAYSNLMVQAKGQSADNQVLGASSWINVVSPPSDDKWSPEEGDALIQMLRKLRTGGIKPDIYVVTPFVVVQNNLRSEILNSRVLEGWVDKPRDWVNERVGTVHTVQGREADIVFFVLGASSVSQNGARVWAGGRPNLLNVAVTRAKTNLYVIGNRANWKSAGHFATLDRLLPV
jgi:hypothetical protein